VTNDLLEIDVRLLVLRYGRTRVLEVLARTGNLSLDDLERQLQALAERAKPKRAKRPLMNLVDAEVQQNPAISDPLRRLAVAFENRTFLPHLRDVVRFLDRNGVTHGKLKSRSAAAPVLVRLLARLPADELARLGAHDKATSDSDYALLARAIMGTPSPKGPGPEGGK
jgi:hypothetical protein